MKSKKEIEIKIKLSNRVIYTLIVTGILAIISVGVYALASGIDTSKGYHESNQVSVDVSGNEKTLQEAIDAGDFSGGSGSWSQSGNDIYYDGGNVGIGTSSPSADLEVMPSSSDIPIKVGRKSGQPSIKGTGDWLILDAPTDGRLGLNYWESGNVIIANGGGNVGIGTTSPSATLDVNGGIKVSGNSITAFNACSESKWGEIRKCTWSSYRKVLCVCNWHSSNGWKWRPLDRDPNDDL